MTTADPEQAQTEKLIAGDLHEQPRNGWVKNLTRMIYGLGCIGFVMSLGMTVYADRTPDGYIEMPLSGIGALLIGWFLFLGLCPAWAANFLLPPTIYYLERDRPRVAFWCASVSVITSLTIFLAIHPFDRGQVGGIIFEGCWVWIGSIGTNWPISSHSAPRFEV